MKVAIMQVMVIDFDDVESESGVSYYVENAIYANDCISPKVVDKKVFEIGDLDDDCILNRSDATKEEILEFLESHQ